MSALPTVIIQARMGSQRLPGKVLAPIRDEPMLSLIVNRVRLAKRIGSIVVATTNHVRDGVIAELCQDLMLPVFKGNECDVLGRYYFAAQYFGATSIVRVTSDCPFVDPGILDSVIELLQRPGSDYASNTLVRTYPDGLDVEAFTFAALAKAHREAKGRELREHVTLYFTGRRPHLASGQYNCMGLMLMQNLSQVQWSVDVPEDLERIQALSKLTHKNAGWEEIFQAASANNLLPKLLGNAAQTRL